VSETGHDPKKERLNHEAHEVHEENFKSSCSSCPSWLRKLFWTSAILLGGFQAAAHRFDLSTEDGISYLDVARQYLHGNWSDAINGTWSPLYSWVLSVALLVFRPSPYWEFGMVQLVNFLIYLFALVSFEFFFRRLHPEGISKLVWLAGGWLLFLWASLNWIRVNISTPDMLTAALFFLAAGIALRAHNNKDFAMLGTILGLASLSKAAVFPVSIVFFVVSLFYSDSVRRSLNKVLLAALCFVIVCGPFVLALSAKKGRFTLNDAGKLNYAWFVSPGLHQIPGTHWQGGPPGSGTPVHPTRKISENPDIFEFGSPLAGTYPPWYDPSYWYEGLKIPFNFKRQLITCARNAYFYYEQFLLVLLFGYLLMLWMRDETRVGWKNLVSNGRILIPAIAGLGVYMIAMDLPASYFPLQPTTRYVAPFIVILFACVFASVPQHRTVNRLAAGLCICALVLFGLPLLDHGVQDLRTTFSAKHKEWDTADGLTRMGIHAGDRVAIIGKGHAHQFWAHLAGVKIVAEVSDDEAFWKMEASARDQVLETLRETKVSAVVTVPVSHLNDPRWRKTGANGFCIYLIKRDRMSAEAKID